jgi:sugar lactone lactonase YvrE
VADEVTVVVQTQAHLGEGPVWDAALQRLWWLDIKGKVLHWFDPGAGSAGSTALDRMIGSVAPRANGQGLLAAAEDGVGVLDPATGHFDKRVDEEPDRKANRANDGNVDVGGRYWFGTMADDERTVSGAIYRLDADWTCTRVLDDIHISNTLVCSPDGDWLYVADSPTGRIDRLAIDPGTGRVGARVPWVTVDAGAPDGSAVDAQGYLWNAQWGAGRIVRYAPDGRVDRIVAMPVSQASSCTFGGPELDTLYITTARHNLSAEQLAREPLAGSLLAFKPGVKGLPLPPFAG